MSNFCAQQTNERGAALLVFIVFFLVTSLVLVLAIARNAYDDILAYRTLQAGKQSFYGAEAGIEDAVYRHRRGDNYSNTESFSFFNTAVTVTRTPEIDYYDIVSAGDVSGAIRRSEMELALGDGASFSFGLQAGNGGIRLSSNSRIVGNAFANGTIVGSNPGSEITGAAISAGPGGSVSWIDAADSMWAHTISNSIVGKDAYYAATSTITGTIVGGTSYPGSADQATATLPVSDAKVAEWEDTITTTGSVISSTSTECSTGTYTVPNGTVFNNVKIECNVFMGNTNVTLMGPLWISGNLEIKGTTITASSSLGTRSVQVIVDNPSNRTTSSKVSITTASHFTSGNASSYVFIISMNQSAENGGLEKAISVAQSAEGPVLIYAGHGLIDLGNSISLREVTGYQINVGQQSEITYESGLANLLFTSGPGGGFTINAWEEVE